MCPLKANVSHFIFTSIILKCFYFWQTRIASTIERKKKQAQKKERWTKKSEPETDKFNKCNSYWQITVSIGINEDRMKGAKRSRFLCVKMKQKWTNKTGNFSAASYRQGHHSHILLEKKTKYSNFIPLFFIFFFVLRLMFFSLQVFMLCKNARFF